MKTSKEFEFLLKYGGVIVFLIYGFSRSLRGTQGHEKILSSNFAHMEISLRITSMKNFRSFRQTLFKIRDFQYVRLFPKKTMQKTHVKIPNKVCRKLLKFFVEVILNEISM